MLSPMQFCSICCNSGLMHDSDFCPHTICNKCVPLPHDIPPDPSFKCLYCFSYPDGQQRTAKPYMVLLHHFYLAWYSHSQYWHKAFPFWEIQLMWLQPFLSMNSCLSAIPHHYSYLQLSSYYSRWWLSAQCHLWAHIYLPPWHYQAFAYIFRSVPLSNWGPGPQPWAWQPHKVCFTHAYFPCLMHLPPGLSTLLSISWILATQTEVIFTLLLVTRGLPPFWRSVTVQLMGISTETLLQVLSLLLPKKLLLLMEPRSGQNTLTLLACGGILKSLVDMKVFVKRCHYNFSDRHWSHTYRKQRSISLAYGFWPAWFPASICKHILDGCGTALVHLWPQTNLGHAKEPPGNWQPYGHLLSLSIWQCFSSHLVTSWHPLL